jgi:hypothetical protein
VFGVALANGIARSCASDLSTEIAWLCVGANSRRRIAAKNRRREEFEEFKEFKEFKEFRSSGVQEVCDGTEFFSASNSLSGCAGLIHS